VKTLLQKLNELKELEIAQTNAIDAWLEASATDPKNADALNAKSHKAVEAFNLLQTEIANELSDNGRTCLSCAYNAIRKFMQD
jgi:hypothetical protein